MYYRTVMKRLHSASIFLLLIEFCGMAANLAANKKPPAAPVNLNTATSEELQTVPGIGPATAEKILQMRKNYGAFKSVDDLLAIKGIGAKRLEKMRKYLTIGKTSSSTKPATLTKPAAPQPKADPPGPPRSSIPLPASSPPTQQTSSPPYP